MPASELFSNWHDPDALHQGALGKAGSTSKQQKLSLMEHNNALKAEHL